MKTNAFSRATPALKKVSGQVTLSFAVAWLRAVMLIGLLGLSLVCAQAQTTIYQHKISTSDIGLYSAEDETLVTLTIHLGEGFDPSVDYGVLDVQLLDKSASSGNLINNMNANFTVAYGVLTVNPLNAITPNCFSFQGELVGKIDASIRVNEHVIDSDGNLYDRNLARVPGYTSDVHANVIVTPILRDYIGAVTNLLNLEMTVNYGPKKDCDCTCKAGAVKSSMGSVDVRVDLGKGLQGNGFLTLKSDLPTPFLSSPYSLNLHSTPELHPYFTNSMLRQALSPQALADIVVSNDYSYEIRFYPYASRGSNSIGLYLPDTNALYKTITIQNPNGSNNYNTLLVTDRQTGVLTNVTTYTFDTNSSTWSMQSYNGLHVESASRTWNSNNTERTEIKKILEPGLGGAVRYQEQKLFHEFAWGEELIQQVIDPDGARLTNSWDYYTNSAQNGYTSLKQKVSATGAWERYEYDASNRITNQYSSFLNATNGCPTNQCRVITTTYSTSNPMQTVVESLLGQEVSRRYKAYYANVVQDIQCQTPGASWTASDNLITTTTNYPSGNFFVGQTKSVLHPDGTMEFYQYLTNSTYTFQTNIVYAGQPNTGKSAVQEGTKTVTVLGPMHEMVSRTVYNVTGGTDGATLSSEIFTYAGGDDYHVSPTISYLDGTTTQTISDCCGVSSTTDKDGSSTQYIYDGQKRQTGTTLNNLSITTTNVLDAAGNILQTVRVGNDASLITLSSASYDLASRVVKETNALGNATSYTNTFDAVGQLIKTITYADGSTRIETNALDGSLLAVSGTGVRPMRYDYGVDFSGTNGAGTRLTNFYTREIHLDASGGTNEWVQTFTDMVGRRFKTVYASASGTPSATSTFSAQGQLAKQVDPDGVATLYAYSPKGELAYTVLDLNQDGTINFGGGDRITYTTNDVASDHGTTVRRTQIYGWNTASSSTATLLSTTETSVDGLSTWTTLWNNGTAVNATNQTVYDAAHGYRIITSSAADGSTTVNTNQYGRSLSMTRKDATGAQIGQTSFGYDAHGRQSQVIDARIGTNIFSFNNAEQISGSVTPAPAAGQSPQVTTNYFDNMGRTFAITLPDSTSVTNEFYLTGDLKRTYGSRTYPVGYGYDAQGRMTTMTNWTSFLTAGARVTTWTYNAYRGFLTGKTYDGNVAGPAYNYTAAGRLQTRLWARGTNTTYSYNNAGDLSAITYNDGSTPNVSYGYDRRGRQNTITTGTTVCTLAYNDVNELLSESYSGGPLNGLAVTNAYDTLLRRNANALDAQTSTLTTYGYDAASRLKTVSNGNNKAGYGYLANSPLVSTISFTNNGSLRLTTTKSYDNLNRLTAISSATNAVAVASSGYAYNAANQRTSVTNTDSSRWAYQYDKLGQVTSGIKYWSDASVVAGQQFGYAFDDIGNRTTTTAGGSEFGANLRWANYSVNNLNQYTSLTVPGAVDVIGDATNTATVTVNNQGTYRKGTYYRKELSLDNSNNPVYPSVTNLAVLQNGTNADIITNAIGNVFLPKTPEAFTYDADGNLKTDGRWTYSWDAENRLISMTNIAGVPAAAQMRLDFGYDYMSRRISKAVVVSGSTNSLHFTYDGWNLIAELNGTNHALIRSYMWGSDLSGSMQGAGGVGGLLAISSPSSAQFTCFDGNGNITALIDSTNSSIVGQYEYGPFGEVIRVTGQTIKANPFGFSTKYQDDETSFLYYGLRFYNSSMGSWLSRDPIEEQGGFNLSTFAANDLINSIDILGLAINKPACVAKLAALGIKAAKLAAEIAKYDPVADGKGGFPMKYGSGKTTPGGHFKEIMDLKRGVYNDLIDYYKYCVCDKCDGGEPPPKLFENLVNQHIPVPVYPSSYLLLVPGSNGFWLGVGTGATVVGVGAGIGVGVLTAPEITIPAIFKCYAH